MRPVRPVHAAALVVFALAFSTRALAAPGSSPRPASAPAGPRVEVATFAGGCFWTMETQFERRPGVLSVVSGYTGGTRPDPTYEEVGSGSTGHLESVEIRFDPARVSYDRLLDLFWHSIDPTQDDGQFCDRGTEYRSAIFVHGEGQRRQAEASKRALEASGVVKRPIVTRIMAAGTFYPAEAYHQDFGTKNPESYHRYRLGCGRDRRLEELWGRQAVKPLAR